MDQPASFNFFPFGDENKASSRLRAWMTGRRLRELGHVVEMNAHSRADWTIFQKRAVVPRVREAREYGSTIVYDFDDNYLLENVGAKERTVMVMNVADVVSVGSPKLLELASRYHDHVFLFENPVDVPVGGTSKSSYEWRNRIAWFGAPENIEPLRGLGLDDRVTTITRDGDIEWSRESIERVLVGFDLVVLPMKLDDWTSAKNANRLIKCVALGVPVLASRTCEHERVFKLLGLPEWLLMEPHDDWGARIHQVMDRYGELPEVLESARSRTFEHWGLDVTVDRWLSNIRTLSRRDSEPRTPVGSAAKAFEQVDVIVLRTNPSHSHERTMASLRCDQIPYRSVTLISATPADWNRPAEMKTSRLEIVDHFDDYFQIYNELAHRVGHPDAAATLLVRAGTKLTRGFFAECSNVVGTGHLALFQVQSDSPVLGMGPRPALRVVDILSNPFFPEAVLLPNELFSTDHGLDSSVGDFCLWELLIDVCHDGRVPLVAVSTPLVLAPDDHSAPNAANDYGDYLALTQPDIEHDYQCNESEANRLNIVFHSAVVEKHHGLFAQYASTLVPRGRSASVSWKGSLRRLGRSLGGDGQNSEDPTLVRAEDGTVYLLDNGMRRHVAAQILVDALVPLFGAVRAVRTEDVIRTELGPPAELYCDPSDNVFFVAGGLRYKVSGAPKVQTASYADLQDFPLSRRVALDLRRGSPAAHMLLRPARIVKRLATRVFRRITN